MSYVQELIPPRPAPAVAIKPVSASRITGVVLLTLWALLGVALVYMIVSGWDVEKFTRYGPRYLSGLWVTLSLVGVSLALGALLSLPIATTDRTVTPLADALFTAVSTICVTVRGSENGTLNSFLPSPFVWLPRACPFGGTLAETVSMLRARKCSRPVWSPSQDTQ